MFQNVGIVSLFKDFEAQPIKLEIVFLRYPLSLYEEVFLSFSI